MQLVVTTTLQDQIMLFYNIPPLEFIALSKIEMEEVQGTTLMNCIVSKLLDLDSCVTKGCIIENEDAPWMFDFFV